MSLKVGILGCGNMGTAIVQGLKTAENIDVIRVYDVAARLRHLLAILTEN